MVVAGCAVPWVRVDSKDSSGAKTCTKYGLIKVTTCGSTQGFDVADWGPSTGLPDQCKKRKQHLQAAAAFAVLTVFVVMAAIALVIVQDLLQLFTVFNLLSGI